MISGDPDFCDHGPDSTCDNCAEDAPASPAPATPTDIGERIEAYEDALGLGDAQLARAASSRLALEDTIRAKVERLQTALGKVNEIRNSIIGTQTVNWSEHVYPLVAVLDEAGIKGESYPASRERFGTMLERTLAAERERDEARAERDRAREEGRREGIEEAKHEVELLATELAEWWDTHSGCASGMAIRTANRLRSLATSPKPGSDDAGRGT